MTVSQNGASVGMSKTARRHGALASGTALAAFVAAGMFSPMSVEQAQAACTLNGIVVVCTGTTPGTTETANAPRNLSVEPGANVTSGITIDVSAGANNINANVAAANNLGAAAIVNVGAINDHAIELLSSGGAITMTTGAGTRLTGGSGNNDGIRIRNSGNGGSIDLNLAGSVTSGARGEALDIQNTGKGDITIKLSNGGVTGDGEYKSAKSDVVVVGSSGGGNVKVDVKSGVSLSGGDDLGDHGLWVINSKNSLVRFDGSIDVTGSGIVIGASPSNDPTNPGVGTATKSARVFLGENSHIEAGGYGVYVTAGGPVSFVNLGQSTILAGADGVNITSGDDVDAINAGKIGASGTPVGGSGIVIDSGGAVTISDLYDPNTFPDPDPFPNAKVGGAIYATLDGINVLAVDGIDIDLSHGQYADPANPSLIVAGRDGIIAHNTGTGDVSVKTGKITAVDDGVIATADAGSSYVEVTDRLIADGLFGAAAFATGGDATVRVNAEVSGATAGIGPDVGAQAQVIGAGVATADVNQSVTSSKTGAQAFQFGDDGAARVFVNSDGDNDGQIHSTGVGVFAWKTGDGTVLGDPGDPVVGIDVYVDGPISGPDPTSDTDRTSGPGIWAVWGDNLFGGAGPISGSGEGDMYVSTGANGTIYSSANAFHVVRNGGDGEVFVGVGAQTDATGHGVYIYRTRTETDGPINEDSNTAVFVGYDTDDDGVHAANIVAGKDGIRIDAPFALHTVTVNIKGDEDERSTVTAGQSAVRINTFSVFGNNDVYLNNDGGLKGAGTGKNSTVVIGTDGTVNINDNAGATIETSAGIGGRALDVDAGEVIHVQNDGSLHGNVRLVAAGEDGDGISVHMTNTASDSWNYSGFNYIAGPGDLILDNDVNGVATAGPSSYTFFNSTNGNVYMNNDGVFNANGFNGFLFWETPGGAAGDGTSTFRNRGTLNVSGFLDFNGLDNFNNEGGLVSMQNGNTGDLIIIRDPFDAAPDYVGGNYNASGDARLAFDAELTPGGDSDVLGVRGNVNGQTMLDVNDLDYNLPGQYDPFGRVFARVGGNTQVGDFVTDGGIDKGLFRYDAYLSGEDYEAPDGFIYDSQWVLASTLDAEAYEFPVATYGAQNLWHASTGVWLDRTADLRSAFGETTMPSIDLKNEGATVSAPGNVTPGVWGRVFGGTLERDIDNTSYAPDGLEGPEHRYSGHFNQDYYGFMAGVDFGKEDIGANGQNVAWLFGVFGGYTGSNLDFSNTQTEFDYSQGSIGGYVTYLNGGFFIDTAVKADFGNMDYSTQMGGKDSSDYTSIGVIVDTGYRFNGSSGWFVEPKATLAYVNTSFDDMTVLGTGVSFSDGDSLRGRLGARVGTSIVNNGNVIEPYLEASVWNEFDGDNSATLASNGFNVPVTYDAGGVYGEVVLGANIINVGNGWNAFGKGAVQFGDDSLLGFSGNLGFRKNW